MYTCKVFFPIHKHIYYKGKESLENQRPPNPFCQATKTARTASRITAIKGRLGVGRFGRSSSGLSVAFADHFGFAVLSAFCLAFLRTMENHGLGFERKLAFFSKFLFFGSQESKPSWHILRYVKAPRHASHRCDLSCSSGKKTTANGTSGVMNFGGFAKIFYEVCVMFRGFMTVF